MTCTLYCHARMNKEHARKQTCLQIAAGVWVIAIHFLAVMIAHRVHENQTAAKVCAIPSSLLLLFLFINGDETLKSCIAVCRNVYVTAGTCVMDKMIGCANVPLPVTTDIKN